MIAIQSWVNRLFNRCAKTDTKNTYTAIQTFSKEIISKSDKDVHTEPSASNTGVTNVITFLDSKDTVLGNIECFRTNTDSIGLRLRLKDHYLGFKLSDEGIITSFVDHPFKPGPDTQIATVKYVTDSYDEIFNLFKELQATVRDHADKINDMKDLLGIINELVINIDSLPTEGSNNLVYSGGVYSYLHDNLENIKKNLTEYVTQLIEENRLSGLTFTKSVVRETDFTWSTENFDETYTATNTGFLVFQTSTKRWWEVQENDKIIAGGGGDGYGVHEALRTIPVRANKKYRIKGKVGSVAFYYLSYKLGD